MADTTEIVTLTSGFAPPDETQWRTLAQKVLKGAGVERLTAQSADGIGIAPLYTAKDAFGGPAEAPGAAPFMRGFAPAGGRARWQARQLHAGTELAAVQGAAGEDLSGGSEAVTIRVAAPGQTGLGASALRAVVSSLQGGKVYLEPGAAAMEAASAVRDLEAVAGLGIDPVGTLARTGETILLAAGDKAQFIAIPPTPAGQGTTLVADGRPFHEAGGSEAQELAGLLGAFVFYLRALYDGGVDVPRAIPAIALALAADADLFLTIAKLRAARRLVWRVADACGAGPAAAQLSLSVTTSERMMTRRDPWVNMLRTTAATTAAAIGGADAIAVLPFTWALGQPDDFARRIARNTHHVLAEESGLARVADPAGGTWSVEKLTDELAAKAWAIFQDWESKGGIVTALRSGAVAADIDKVAAARAQLLATGRSALTGTSAFPLLGSDNVTVAPWPETPVCRGALLPPRRLAAPFEQLRDAADAMGGKARVFIAALGPAAEHAARATWVTNLLATGGIAAIHGEGFTSSVDAGRAFGESGTAVACICGTDETYGQIGEAVAGVLKQAGARRVYLAGRPVEEHALRAAGVDGFWYAGQNMLTVLAEVQGALS